MHTDGFPPGHIKCMIYLQPLDEDHGLFELDEKKIKYDKPGYGIIFKNSDVPHRAIPGLKKDRYVLEYTLMRTLFKVNETKYIASKPDLDLFISTLLGISLMIENSTENFNKSFVFASY